MSINDIIVRDVLGRGFRVPALDELPPGDALTYRPALEAIKAQLTRMVSDSRGETSMLGFKRACQYRKDASAVRYTGASVPEGHEVWSGMRLIPEDEGAERINTTSGGLALAFLSRYAAITGMGQADVDNIHIFAEALLPMQWLDPSMLIYGGFMAGPYPGNSASAFGTGIMGLGMLEAWRTTKDARYLNSAVLAANFCLKLSDPNTYWFPKYGVNPINRTSGGTTWFGFCDEVAANDQISTTSSLWNMKAAELCMEVSKINGDAALFTAATQCRDFMASGAGCGSQGPTFIFDYFAVSTNEDATYVTGVWVNSASHHYMDHTWHAAGDHVATGTRGTDGIEYAWPALVNLGLSPDTVKAAYSYVRDLPFATVTSFSQAYIRGCCLTGFLRLAPASPQLFGTYYDCQGAGSLGGFKARYFPVDFQVSLPILLYMASKCGILDENFNNIWVSQTTYDFCTQGTIVVAEAGLALLDAVEGRV